MHLPGSNTPQHCAGERRFGEGAERGLAVGEERGVPAAGSAVGEGIW